MAIRIRQTKNGPIALCAAETDKEEGDLYLDDSIHYCLAAKFAQDWADRIINWKYPEIWAEMEKHKKRDAKEEIERWLKENEHKNS